MIGIYGGTFDPIHFGHLRPALEVLQGLGLEQVRFVPLNVAVHRPQPIASAPMRLAMLKAAIRGQPGFVADPRELQREGGSYTYDTLLSLRRDLGSSCPLCLMIGADAYHGFLDWYRPLEVLELAHLVVMRRPGHDAATGPALRKLYLERGSDGPVELESAPGGRILFQQVSQLEISSTRIRDLVTRGLSPHYLLPEAVWELMAREGLYGPVVSGASSTVGGS
ncbi:nicotinate-nucleotide adenylyltransferase [Thiorhodococcus mannitoliphagus]|uniref:Probable nicotinate-nucleotide adenylyltransferase n=1 Tax=Thiorhodococcus mannitoliphagus TaxID=329406 RepID=A0A6P1DVF3_9GAMM|nr:nicotinate-nucleotide adenylyltransferase [Thiorhodococcus mannitoliphagus]NEX21460.1 nicotinate-nucleotide adenylyltransferase [Thiorhodococcus mannitoliphagus]